MSKQDSSGLSPTELNRIVRKPEAERLTSVSWETIVRENRKHIVDISKRCRGIRLKHLLKIDG